MNLTQARPGDVLERTLPPDRQIETVRVLRPREPTRENRLYGACGRTGTP